MASDTNENADSEAADGPRARIARGTYPERLFAAPGPLVEHVGEDERRDADDERAGHDFQNAHTYLLVALRYGAGGCGFKTVRGTFRGTIPRLKRLT